MHLSCQLCEHTTMFNFAHGGHSRRPEIRFVTKLLKHFQMQHWSGFQNCPSESSIVLQKQSSETYLRPQLLHWKITSRYWSGGSGITLLQCLPAASLLLRSDHFTVAVHFPIEWALDPKQLLHLRRPAWGLDSCCTVSSGSSFFVQRCQQYPKNMKCGICNHIFKACLTDLLLFRCFDFLPSIANHIKSASLIICHAGVGNLHDWNFSMCHLYWTRRCTYLWWAWSVYNTIILVWAQHRYMAGITTNNKIYLYRNLHKQIFPPFDIKGNIVLQVTWALYIFQLILKCNVEVITRATFWCFQACD